MENNVFSFEQESNLILLKTTFSKGGNKKWGGGWLVADE